MYLKYIYMFLFGLLVGLVIKAINTKETKPLVENITYMIIGFLFAVITKLYIFPI